MSVHQPERRISVPQREEDRPYLTRRTAGSCGSCSKFLIKASSLFMVLKDLLSIVA
jgi:hypothetical protein